MNGSTTGRRVRATLVYYGMTGSYYFFAGLVMLTITAIAPIALAVSVAVVAFVAMSCVTLLALMFEEDWWNDFRHQTRAIIVGVATNAVVLCFGVWLGLHESR